MSIINKSVRKTGKQQTSEKNLQDNKFVAFFKNSSVHFLLGLVLLLLSVFMMISFLSFFITGGADQSVLDSLAAQDAADAEFVTENVAGKQGAALSDYFINNAFGVSSIFIVLFMAVLGLKLMRVAKVRLWKWFISCSASMIWLSVFLAFTMKHLYEDTFFYLGGTHGYNISNWLEGQVGVPGVWMLLLFAAVCLLVYLSAKTVDWLRMALSFNYLKRKEKAPHGKEEKGETPEEFVESWGGKQTASVNTALVGDDTAGVSDKPAESILDNSDQAVETAAAVEQPEESIIAQTVDDANDDELDYQAAEASQSEMEIVVGGEEEDAIVDHHKFEVEVNETEAYDPTKQEPYNPRLDLEFYKFPTIDLMRHFDDDKPQVDMDEQKANEKRIVETLNNFGIDISSIKATVGPTVTLYEITPAAGVRIAKIRNLEDDIALSLSALGVRIIAPIPGRGTIGIEVPNKDSKIVSGQSVIGSRKFQDTTYELPLVLGKTISNEVAMVDLAKMPHILVAGATGQGKSVGLNTMIASLLYKKHPSELKLVLVDPKKVEFSIYADLEHHFLAELPDSTEPIVTDVKKVVSTLNSLCVEMDARYDLLKLAHVRNLKEYNQKFISRNLNPERGHRFLPYIVVVIDEFGDLIMTAGREVEQPIARIAQLARAVGIHMIIATQRPTTSIITGNIKANFPARVAFKVAQMIDSRTILDRPGANQLIGKGDMLFLSGNDPIRVQCAFIDTPEIESIVKFISDQQGYTIPFYLPEVAESGADDMGGDSNAVDLNHLDPMFEDVCHLIVATQQGSTSLIQRKFSIGYNRAGRLMDQLEKAGIVGPAQGSKPREVLCLDEMELDVKLSSLKSR